MLKRILIGLAALVVVVVALFVLLVGPWPTYGPSDVMQESYYVDAAAAIDAVAAESSFTQPGRLEAGWAAASIVPPWDIPLAGFGDREGKPSQGVHDEIFAKALALSDGVDKVVIVGVDMLIIPENVIELVHGRLEDEAGLRPSQVFFAATHSHSGPGAFGPGLMANMFMGPYDDRVPGFLADAFMETIVQSLEHLEPASLAKGDLELPERIRNRARDAAVDPELNYLVVKQDDGDLCHVASFAGHSTIIGGDSFQFSGDYPGYMQRAIEKETGGFAMFLAGAMGSMSASAPAGDDDFARARAMGETLAEAVLTDAQELEFSDSVQVASAGVPFDMPSFQLRINKNWRVSPFLPGFLGIDSDAWIHGVRLGDILLFGTPCDFSGEIAVELKHWARGQGIDLWATSFNGDYVGYISPDRYYDEPKGTSDDYEMYFMSWMGPNQEALMTAFFDRLVDALQVGQA
jgi:hypothetical protein